MSAIRKPQPQELSPALSIEIGKAMVLSRIVLQEVNDSELDGLKRAFSKSNITPDNFVCLVIGLRDTLIEVCRLGGMPS